MNETTQTRVIRDPDRAGRSRASAARFQPIDPASYRREADLSPRQRPAAGRSRQCGDPSTREGNIFTIAGPESTWNGEQKTGSLIRVVTYEGSFGADFHPARARRPPRREVRYSRRRQDHAPAPSTRRCRRTRAPAASAPPSRIPKFTRDVYKVDVTKFLGSATSSRRASTGSMQDSTIDRYSGGGGIINYRLTRRGRRHLLPPPLLRRRRGAWLRARRFDDLAAADPADDRAEDAKQLVLRAGQLAGGASFTINAGLRWERQESRRPRRQTRVRSERQLGAAHRLRLGLREEQPQQAVTRTGAASTRASRWTSTSARSAASCQCFCYNFDPAPTNFVAATGAPSRTIAARRQHRRRSTRTSRASTSDECMAGSSTTSARNLVRRRQVRAPQARARHRGLPGPAEGEYFIANPGAGSAPRWGSTTTRTRRPRRRRSA